MHVNFVVFVASWVLAALALGASKSCPTTCRVTISRSLPFYTRERTVKHSFHLTDKGFPDLPREFEAIEAHGFEIDDHVGKRGGITSFALPAKFQ